MSDSDSFADEGLDQWLADHHHELALDIAATLDVEAGLGEALIPTYHADLIADLSRTLDIEAGLGAIVAPSATRSSEPSVPGLSSTAAEHVAATGPVQAKAEQPQRRTSLRTLARVAAWRSQARLAVPAHPASDRAGFRNRAQALVSNPDQVRNLVIIAVIFIVLAVTTPMMISKILSSPPAATTLALDVRDYGVTAKTDVGTVVFTVAITAQGAGTVHYTVQPENQVSNQPVRDENLVFTGPLQTKEIVYSIPYTCGSGQRLQGGMRMEITKPESIGASYAPYDVVCPEGDR